MSSSGYIKFLLFTRLMMLSAEWKKAAVLAIAMAANNILFFMLWVVFFATIDSIGDWRMQEVGTLYGILCFAVGLGMFACYGVRTIADRIIDGDIDRVLAAPRHPLPFLIFSGAVDAGAGDMLSAPIFWFYFGGARLADLPILLAVSLVVCVLFLAVIVVFQSLAFWLRGGNKLAGQLFESTVILSTTPQNAQTGVMKFIMISIIPAWFTGFMPVNIVKNMDWTGLLVLTAITAAYVALAILIFNAGLRRYRRA